MLPGVKQGVANEVDTLLRHQPRDAHHERHILIHCEAQAFLLLTHIAVNSISLNMYRV